MRLSSIAPIAAGTFHTTMPISTTKAAMPTQPVSLRPSAVGAACDSPSPALVPAWMPLPFAMS